MPPRGGVVYCISALGRGKSRSRAPADALLLVKMGGVALQCLRLHPRAELQGRGAGRGGLPA